MTLANSVFEEIVLVSFLGQGYKKNAVLFFMAPGFTDFSITNRIKETPGTMLFFRKVQIAATGEK